MKKATFKKLIASTLAALVCVGSFAGCGKTADNSNGSDAAPSSASSGETYTVGICNYVDDASLNQNRRQHRIPPGGDRPGAGA